jgi:CRISPR/Cas system CSM-associated protein Csm3 (group 7 of RAMP superfamily)
MTIPPLLELHVRIVLQSAAHVGTGLGLGQLLDDRVVQGPHPQFPDALVPYLPGSTIKGRLRYHLRQLAVIFERPDTEAKLFGDLERPGDLRVTDAHLSDLGLVELLRTKSSTERSAPLDTYLVRGARSFVQLSRKRRVARDERLFRIELTEAGLTFSGTIYGALHASKPREDLALLCAAIHDLTHLGGYKGRGLGSCRMHIDSLRLGEETLDWRSLIEEKL